MAEQKYSRKRIFGTETEFGSINPPSVDYTWLGNGGLIYLDAGPHIEYASPECSNPLDAVLYDKAGEAWAMKNMGTSSTFYKNNWSIDGDSGEVYFGAHESYFIHRDIVGRLDELVPFLITRQLFAGSGKITPKGNFEISQRSNSIEFKHSMDSTRQRGIIHSKDESLSGMGDWYRFHLLIGDANMCQVAQYLKLGTTGLVLDLLEDNSLPQIKYSDGYAVDDIHSLSKKTKGWHLEGSDKSALSIQAAYLDVAKKMYTGRDSMTDDLLSRWEYTLDALRRNKKSLIGQVDWITKKAIIDSYAAKHSIDISNNYDNAILRNIDLQYHEVDRAKGLFYSLQKKGMVEMLFSDEQIDAAVESAPSDTRAHFRGLLAQTLQKFPANNQKYVINWYRFRLDEHNNGHILRDRIGRKFEIFDPWDNYPKESKILEDILVKEEIKEKIIVTPQFSTSKDEDRNISGADSLQPSDVETLNTDESRHPVPNHISTNESVSLVRRLLKNIPQKYFDYFHLDRFEGSE